MTNNLHIWVDEFGEGLLAAFMPFQVPSGEDVLRRLTNPTINGTGAAGTAHTYTAGTFNLTPPPITYEWFVDGVSVGTGTSYTPPTATTPDQALLTVVETVAGLPLLQATSAAKAITNVTTPSIPWPASLAASKILKIGEVVPADNGRREIQMDTFTIPTDFRFWVNSSPMDGAQMTGATQLTGAGGAGGYKKWNNALAVGEKHWITGFWEYVPTGETRHAFASSGTTGDGKTLTAITGDTSYGQYVCTIAGTPPVSAWPAMSTAAKNDAIAEHDSGATGKLYFFEDDPGSGDCTAVNNGHTATVLAYCAFKGDTTVYARVKTQIDTLLQMDHHPNATGMVASQHDLYFIVFFTILRKTPAIWDGEVSPGVPYITAAQKTAISVIIEGIMYDAAYLASDTRSGGDSPDGKGYRMQRGQGHDAKNKGSDLSFPICARMQCGASWFGIATAKTMIDTFDRAAFRTKMKDAFIAIGGSYNNSNIYRTYNWANTGYATDPANVVGGASAWALTDAQMEEALHKTSGSFRYFTKVFDDFEGQVVDQSKNGSYMTKTLVPYNPDNASHSTMKYWGWTFYGVQGNAGKVVAGSPPTDDKLGIIKNTADGPAMPTWSGAFVANQAPPAGTEQRMFYNLNGQDEGGPRSSISYGAYDLRMVLSWLICHEMNGTWPDKTRPLMADCLQKTFDAIANYAYLNSKGYWSLSHGGTKGGGGGPIDWPAGGDPAWRMPANLGLADCIRGKMGF